MNPLRVAIQYVTAPFKWLASWPARLLAGPRRILGLSLPARTAWLLEIGLLLVTAGVVGYQIADGRMVADRTMFGPATIAQLLLLLIAIPLTAYFLLRLWLQGDVSRYPDIDRAWSDGLASLAENGIEITDLPLFLVIGVADESLLRRFMRGSGAEMVVEGVPRGSAPIRWYARRDAIYLTVEGVGWLATLDTPLSRAPASASGGPTGFAATMVIGNSLSGGSATELLPELNPAVGMASPMYGTLLLDEVERVDSPPERKAASSHRFDEKDAERLRYVAGRLRHARYPFCGNNGVLTLLPVHSLEDNSRSKDIPTALKTDLEAIRDETRLVSPVTLCVVGLESELGLRELVTRVGRECAVQNRVGSRFDVSNFASDENLDALSAHACGSFEDNVYKLFRDGLEESGNQQLYSMLCRVRHRLQQRLRNVLVNGVAGSGGDESDDPAVRCGGCYFAATGEHDDQQAFVSKVFTRVEELANEVQWKASAYREDGRYRTAAQLMIIAAITLAILSGWFLFKLLR